MTKAIIQEWHADAVVAFFGAKVAANLELAGKFVEEEARGNLAAISEPEWGRGYRNEIVGRLLTAGVIPEGKGYAAVVGVAKAGGKGGDYHGFFIEVGSATAPAHPWLRPALFNNLAAVKQLLEGK
jgi:hypothetical protein